MFLNKRFLVASLLAVLGAVPAHAFGVSPAQIEIKELKEESLVERFLHVSDYNKIIDSVLIDVSGPGADAIQISESVQLDFFELEQIKIPFQIQASGFAPGEYEATITLTAPLNIEYAPTLESKVFFTVTDQDHQNYEINHFDLPQFEQGDSLSFSFRDANLGNVPDRVTEIDLTLRFEGGELQTWTTSDLESAAAFTENFWTLETDLPLPSGQHSLSVEFSDQAFEVTDRLFYVPPKEGFSAIIWLCLAILVGSTPLALYFYRKST